MGSRLLCILRLPFIIARNWWRERVRIRHDHRLRFFYRVCKCPRCDGWGFDESIMRECQRCDGSGFRPQEEVDAFFKPERAAAKEPASGQGGAS